MKYNQRRFFFWGGGTITSKFLSQRRNDAHIIPLPLKQPIIEFRKLAPYFFSLTLLDWFGLKCDIVFGGDFFEQFASHFNEISQKKTVAS